LRSAQIYVNETIKRVHESAVKDNDVELLNN